MFDLCLSGRTLEETAVELNAHGQRTKLGTSWTPIKVFRILHNPVYAGFLRWDGIVRKADHDPLVSVETFNEAQERLRSRALLTTAHAPPILLDARRMDGRCQRRWSTKNLVSHEVDAKPRADP